MGDDDPGLLRPGVHGISPEAKRTCASPRLIGITIRDRLRAVFLLEWSNGFKVGPFTSTSRSTCLTGACEARAFHIAAMSGRKVRTLLRALALRGCTSDKSRSSSSYHTVPDWLLGVFVTRGDSVIVSFIFEGASKLVAAFVQHWVETSALPRISVKQGGPPHNA
jgi:hypothetical protein